MYYVQTRTSPEATGRRRLLTVVSDEEDGPGRTAGPAASARERESLAEPSDPRRRGAALEPSYCAGLHLWAVSDSPSLALGTPRIYVERKKRKQTNKNFKIAV